MPRDGRFTFIRQSELPQRDPPVSRRQIVGGGQREKPLAERLEHFGPGQFDRRAARDDRAASTEDGDRKGVRAAVGQQLFFRRTAFPAQRLSLAERQPFRRREAFVRRASRGSDRGCHHQGGGARRSQSVRMRARRPRVPPDQAEIGCAAADIAHEDERAVADRTRAGSADGQQSTSYSAASGSSSKVTPSRPASRAAWTVSSRASSSNDAGTVRTTNWRSRRRASPSPRCS